MEEQGPILGDFIELDKGIWEAWNIAQKGGIIQLSELKPTKVVFFAS